MSANRATGKRVNRFTLDQARGVCAAFASVDALPVARPGWGRGGTGPQPQAKRGAGRARPCWVRVGVLLRWIVARCRRDSVNVGSWLEVIGQFSASCRSRRKTA
jgi:hypothetical protein